MAEWKGEIKGVKAIIHDEELMFEQKKEKVVNLLRKQKRYMADDSGFFDIVECDLDNAVDESEFDSYLDELYDWGDDERVWIG